MPTPVVDYLPFATQSGALVDSQADFQDSTWQTLGFQAGIAQPAQANKVWRQATMVSAAIANYISQKLNIDVLDDGNLVNLIAVLDKAIRSGAHSNKVVTYGGAPVFDCAVATDFEITLAGACSPSLINAVPGQLITIIVHQDGVGGRVFTPPGNLPMGDVDQAVSATSVQMFKVGAGSVLYAVTPVQVS